MNSMKRLWLRLMLGLLVTPLLLLFLFFLGVFCFQAAYELMGYHAFTFNGEKIAMIAREKNDPAECGKIRVVFAINTNTYLESQYCTYTFAKLTQDPSACELLLPGEYGWDCLGTVASLLNTGSGCSSYASGEILCASGVKGRNVGVDDCRQYHEKDLQFWCYIERSRTLEGVNDCQKISDEDPLVKDECSRWYAYKKKDPFLCSLVRNEKLKKICELKIQYAR